MQTVRQLAEMAGITVRTLHHYDAIGLLKPSLVGGNGYRYYGEEALLRLQQILLYRELGFDLDAIKRLMGKKDFSVVRALEAHRQALRRRIERLETLVATVDRTLAAQKGDTTMSDAQLFEGLTAQEKEYAEEAMERWDPQVVRESHRRYAQLSPDQKRAMKAADEALRQRWASLIGTDPAGPQARGLVDEWRKGIEFFYTPTPEILLGLASMYVDDPRFRATYDAVDPRLAEYVRACVEAVYG